MPDSFPEADDAVQFRDACEAVRASAAGKDEAEIRQMLTGELRSRDVLPPPAIIELLAASIAGQTSMSREASSRPEAG